jgi:hypothetical protein
LVIVVLSSLATMASAADARTDVRVALEPAGSQSRLVVTLSSTRRLAPAERPRAVVVRRAPRSYALRRAAASARTSVWRTAPRSDLAPLLGRRVAVSVRTLARTTTVARTVRRPRPNFTPPPSTVQGMSAFPRISRYFVNSRFTDCSGAWPACASERRYSHCAGGGLTGSWRSQVFPPALPARTGGYRVVDAFQHTDGSWGVTYEVTLSTGETGKYAWIVSADGSARGVYTLGAEYGSLRGFTWQQPADC